MVGDQLAYANEELITHCLDKKIIDQHFLNQNVHDVDYFLYHPQQLSGTIISLSLSLSLSLLWGGSQDTVLVYICIVDLAITMNCNGKLNKHTQH
ncbi:hypothetical protein MTR67_017870 [Solanum verrucosum]|uniref:Uncharacterized protein n=1 Tax=Solanum verrucosum TaxID=315347 RepID=A0AAF0QLC1_SOLVR|nr:hypothetical protein MTR67_017870 [Solanum verrucosum]